MRIGIGFDVHPFDKGSDKPLILGGVSIKDSPGLSGHSDADLIAHACADALLGAAGLGDIGEHYPDTDKRWENANSLNLLEDVAQKIRDADFSIVNMDCSVIAEQPRIAPHKTLIQQNLSDAVRAPVTVKGKRAEGLGALGRVEGIACMAVALLE